MSRDPRVNAYIARQAEFAKPILEKLREAMHRACPECEEALKWSAPAFLYRGSILAQMAAFKAHASFGFWQGRKVTGETAKEKEAMGSFGKLRSVADLPDAGTMTKFVRKAMALIDSGEKATQPLKHAKPPLEVPSDLEAAFATNAAARATYDGFPTSARRDYLDWLAGAKRPETRAKRLEQTVEWLAEGKRRHWKYENC
jgi:uncharacterized protein YdeI (YjbR/CyaY-like superfamily)